MLRGSIANLTRAPRGWFSLAVLVSLLLYFVGVKFLVVPALLLYLVFCVRHHDVFKSVLSRLLISLLIFYALFQIATLLELAVMRGTGFGFTLPVTSLLVGLLGFIFPAQPDKKKPQTVFASKADLVIVGVSLLAIVPMAAYLFSGSSTPRMAEFGSIQGVDGTNHHQLIVDYQYKDALLYLKGNYYPASFHLITSFLLDTIDQPNGHWHTGAYLYYGINLFFIVIMVASLLYLVTALTNAAGKRVTWRRVLFGAAVLLPAMLLFYIVPFFYAGFLSYFFIIACMAAAFVYLTNVPDEKRLLPFHLCCYYIFASAAAIAWPLLVPALLITPFVVSSVREGSTLVRKSWLAVITGSLLLMAPYFVQNHYSDRVAADSLNLDGGLKIFHAGLYLVGLAVVSYIMMRKNISESYKNTIFKIIVPLTLLFGGILLYQYFTVGAPRYYGIKVGMLVMVFVLTLVASYVVVATKKLTIVNAGLALFAIPVVCFLLIGINDNPVASLRSAARTYSGEQKPPQFDQEVTVMNRLGRAGDLDQASILTLHYNVEHDKFYAHPQTALWGNLMAYRTDDAGFLFCYKVVYDELLFGQYTTDSQLRLMDQIDKCIQIAQGAKREVIIITDKASEARVQDLYGMEQGVRIITD